MIKESILGLCLFSAVQAQAQKVSPEVLCLATNIYYEARGEAQQGQVAVAMVTLQRVLSDKYPNTICEVVRQKGAFSWTRQKVKSPKKEVLYGTCLVSAYLALFMKWIDPEGFIADHYHNESVNPYWAKSMVLVTQIGRHRFYRPEGAYGQ